MNGVGYSIGKSDDLYIYYGSKRSRNIIEKPRKSRLSLTSIPAALIQERNNLPPIDPKLQEIKTTTSDYIAKELKLKKSTMITISNENIRTILPSKSRTNIRPSLSEQLASIGANADALKASIRHNAGMETRINSFDTVLFSSPSTSFQVGKLTCRYPSPVQFYRSRCEYTFHHPYQSTEIRMVMYYQDMNQLTCTDNKPYRISFRVARHLVHFSDDYDPSRADSFVSIDFPTVLAVSQFRQVIMPLLNNISRVRR
eukprot:gene13739-29215_t